MKRIIQRILGIDELIKSQEKTNYLLEKILKQSKRIADLQNDYNRKYHIPEGYYN